MDQSRRAFLTAATGITVASAGCLSRINPWSGDGSGNDEKTDSKGTNTTDEKDTDGNTTDTHGGQNESTETTDETSEEENNTNESTNESEEKEQLHPNENETEIDQDQYNRSGKSEVVELPEDSVEITATYHLTDDESGVIVKGDIKNVTTEPIDFVDVRVIYYNAAKEKIGEDFVVKRDFDAKQMKTFEVRTPIIDIRGDVAEVGGVPIPQNYVDS